MQVQSTVKKSINIETENVEEKDLQTHTPPALHSPITLSAELESCLRALRLDAVPERAPWCRWGRGDGLEGWGRILRLQQSRQMAWAEARAPRRGWTE